MKVYILTAGEYSDYGNIGVFSSVEKAEDYKQRYPIDGYGGYNDLEEYEIDEWVKDKRICYKICMGKNGDASEPEASTCSPEYVNRPYYYRLEVMTLHVVARNPKHAIKIANEIRAQEIANNKWGIFEKV